MEFGDAWVVIGEGRDAKYEPDKWVALVFTSEDAANNWLELVYLHAFIDSRRPDTLTDVRYSVEHAPLVESE